MPANALLSRLTRVIPRGKLQWSCRCPAHDDKGPSLSVKEEPDGRVLVHCFAGCSVEDVLDSVGLTFSDLYPEKATETRVKPSAPYAGRAAMEALAFECLIVAVAARGLIAGQKPTEQDVSRLIDAVSRIEGAVRYVA